MPNLFSARKMATGGLNLIESAICDLLIAHPGLGNTEVAEALDLESFAEFNDGKETGKNFLTHAILGRMVRDEVLDKSDDHHPRYTVRKTT